MTNPTTNAADTGLECEGACCSSFEYGNEIPGHRGTVRHYRVTHGMKDWGEFNYCEQAVESDTGKGMTCTPVEDRAESLADDDGSTFFSNADDNGAL